MLLAAAAGLGGCASTATYGTGEMPEMAILREVTGGLGAPEEAPIEYKPRAPLVMPPSAGQLPPPVETASVVDEQWPEDPDQRAPGNKFAEMDDRPFDDINPEEARRLSPLAALNRRQAVEENYKRPALDLIVNREQRETFRAAVDEAEGVGVTERRYLTDPPDVVREPAATAPTEFADIEKKRGNFLTRMLTGG